MKSTMVKTWSMHGVLLLLLLLVVGSGASGGVPERRFADPESASDSDLASLCGSFHLLPVGSLGHARALSECLSLRHSLPEGANINGNKPYIHAATTARDSSIRAKGAKRPTPGDKAQLNAGAVKQTQTDGVITDVQHATEFRKTETDNADQQLANDAAAREAEWQQQLADQKANTAYTNDMAAIDAAKRQDVLDAQTVDAAKAKWTKLEETIADAKAKAASDPTVIAEQNVKIKDLEAQRRADEAQRLADEIEAMRDAGLADDAGKAARVKTRTERAHNRAVQAANRETALVEASRARRAAIARQQLLEEQDIVRAKVRAEIEGTDAALALRRKNRATAHTAYQKRIEAYNKEKANIKLRREAFETAEEVRAKRLVKIQEGIDARLKAKVADDLRLANAVEDSVSPQHRKQQDHEEPCTTNEVGCGRGQCVQDRNKPKSKRCICVGKDDGKNCELDECPYDLDDGTGKTDKRKGNKVKNECVRWKAEYECLKCDDSWQMVPKCMKVQGVSEIEVQKTACRGLTEPRNEYEDQLCKMCDGDDVCTSGLRRLEANATTTTTTTTATRALAMKIPDVSLACDKRMAFFTKLTRRPDALPAVGGGATATASAYAAVTGVRSYFACGRKCLERDGSKAAKADTARATLSVDKHCTWVYFEKRPLQKFGTCYMFFTGSFPVHIMRATSSRVGRFTGPSGKVGFVTYPRRWDIFREATPGTQVRVYEDGSSNKYYAHFGRPSARIEGENTFVTTQSTRSGECVSTPDSVLENAQAYAEKTGGLVKQVVPIPPAWLQYGQTRRSPGTVKSTKSQLEWTYTVDRQMRVTKVSGVSSALNSGDRGDEGFEEGYNWVNMRTYYAHLDAPSCAGHLVPYQQKPPNFYFNYVPQHANSNTHGCWFATEFAAASLIFMGCKVKYDIDLDYDENGRLKPHAMHAKMPPWAKAKDVSSDPSRRRRLADTIDAYKNNDLKCHYRFRPYIMNLNLQVVGSQKSDDHCSNLHAAVTEYMPTMLKVDGKHVITTRVYAYLLTKQKPKTAAKVRGTTTTNDLKRFLKVATAMKKTAGEHDTSLSCYAETGNIAAFDHVQMNFDFRVAFLGDYTNTRCLRLTSDLTCQKWSMTPETPGSHYGILTTGDAQCIVHDGNGMVELKKRDGTNDGACGKFEYDLPDHTFTLAQLNPLPSPLTIEDLVRGKIVFGTRHSSCLTVGGTITTDDSQCWKLRVSYYNYNKQRNRVLRHLEEDGEENKESDGDGDQGGSEDDGGAADGGEGEGSVCTPGDDVCGCYAS